MLAPRDADGSSLAVRVIHNFGLTAGERSVVWRGSEADTDTARMDPQKHASGGPAEISEGRVACGGDVHALV